MGLVLVIALGIVAIGLMMQGARAFLYGTRHPNRDWYQYPTHRMPRDRND